MEVDYEMLGEFVLVTGTIVVVWALCIIIPAIVVYYYWKTDPGKTRAPLSPSGFRVYRAGLPCLYHKAFHCLQLVSFGLCYPLLVIESVKMRLRRVDADGTHLSIDADTKGFCKSVWLPTCLFNMLTCGLYTCCGCAEAREDAFLDAHISVIGKEGQPVTFYRAKANWWYRMAAAILTACTCGVAYPYFYVDLVAKSMSRVNLAGQGISSASLDLGDFCLMIWMKGLLFDFLLCGMWHCCGCYGRDEASYTDAALVSSVPLMHEEDTFSFSGGYGTADKTKKERAFNDYDDYDVYNV